MINSIDDRESKEALSIKYQALCDVTAMVGVVNLKKKVHLTQKEMITLKKIAFDKKKIFTEA